jgi:hypothetical protein
MSFIDSVITKQSQPAAQYFPVVVVFLLLLTLGVVIGEAIYLFVSSSDWASIRCLPYVMPFAGIYGHDVNENFRFCMAESFRKQAGESLGPLYKFFGGFIGVLSTLIDSTNSLRVGFATFIGGFTTIISEFGDRFKLFMSQLQLSAQRIKMLMYRVYATFYAMMYMALSSIRAVNNFGGTVLFGFLDTFCFAPETLVVIKGRGTIPMKDVSVGDVFEATGSHVTARFQFMADGQPMVSLPRADGGDAIIVSTNHYMSHEGSWIRAENHPLASRVAPWNGGKSRPLICFNTSDNCIPIADYMFRDYDETTEGAEGAIAWSSRSLNAGIGACIASRFQDSWKELLPAFSGSARICMRDGTHVAVDDISLGDIIRPTGDKVTGIIELEVTEYIELPDGRFTPGTLIWYEPTGTWQRLGDIMPTKVIRTSTPQLLKSLIVLSGSRIEFASGMIIRDYMEVASPWAEDPYSSALKALYSGR